MSSVRNLTPRADQIRTFAAPAIEPPRSPAEAAGELARRVAAVEAEAREAGQQAGYAAGRAAADAARDEHLAAAAQLRAAAAAFEAAGDQLRSADRVALADIEREVVALAIELAAELLGRELADANARVADTLRRAAPLVADRGTPTVRVHPELVDAIAAQLAADAGVWRRAELLGDPSLAPGDCLVDAGACRIDAQLTTAVERLRRGAA